MSFVTALSGLRGAATAIDVIGNNLANLNTVGFKSSSLSFQDVVTDITGSGSRQVGSGVAAPLTVKQFLQGSLQTTKGRLDAAIQGDGFFIVRPATDTSGVVTDPSATLYTRAGNFRIDKNGLLITATGERVQGWSFNAIAGAINPSDPIGDIVVPVGSNRAAKQTANFNATLNLDASSATGATFSVPINVYDSLGNAHVISTTFTKQATANTWAATITSSDPAVTAVTPAAASWTFTFNSSGGLQTVAGPGYNATTGQIENIGLTLNNGAQSPQLLNWSPWQTIPTGTPPVGVGRVSQFAQLSASSSIFQDGLPAAQLTNVLIDDGGAVLAQFSNGSQLEVARLSLASIRNPDTLVSIGNNNFRVGVGTAIPALGQSRSGGRGAIVGGTLESSNVDIADEFTKLIIFQRSYSANAKVVTTTDEISQETINLKR